MNNSMLPRIATRIFDTPLYIHPPKLDAIMAAIGDRIGMAGQVAAQLSPEQMAAVAMPEKQMINMRVGSVNASASRGGQVTLAIIPIFGSLVHRNAANAWSGMRTYESIRKDFRQALNDKSVDGIVFEVASNGGEGHGLFDLVDEIYQARLNNTKRISAIVNEYAYSAGYALVSACHDVYLTRTSLLGSIGVIAKHLDMSARHEEEGLKYTTMFEGARKNDFSPDEPLTDEAASVLREMLVSGNNLFVKTVARNRGLKEKAVRQTEAGLFEGKKAVEAGLADAVLSFNQAIERVARNTKPTGGLSMSQEEQKLGLQHQLEALMKGSSSAEILMALAPLGYMSSTNVITTEAQTAHGDERYEAGKADGKKDGLDYAGEIIGMCALAKKPEMAETLLSSNVGIDAAKKQLIDASAAAGAAQGSVSSTVSLTGTAGAVSPLMADAQARKDQAAQ